MENSFSQKLTPVQPPELTSLLGAVALTVPLPIQRRPPDLRSVAIQFPRRPLRVDVIVFVNTTRDVVVIIHPKSKPTGWFGPHPPSPRSLLHSLTLPFGVHLAREQITPFPVLIIQIRGARAMPTVCTNLRPPLNRRTKLAYLCFLGSVWVSVTDPSLLAEIVIIWKLILLSYLGTSLSTVLSLCT